MWSQARPSLGARALAPLGAALAWSMRARRARAIPWRASAPTVCVGALTIGGAGKTPLALALAQRARALGAEPIFLARGHGGKARQPLRVDPTRHDARMVGDEALTLARSAPTWIARNRADGAQAIDRADAGDLIIVDDGLHNGALFYDRAFATVSATQGIGNGLTAPAGPLREPARRALARADAIIIARHDADHTDHPSLAHALALAGDKPRLNARSRSWLDPGLKRSALFGFCGVGNPEAAHRALLHAARASDAQVSGWRAFPDHHPFRERDARWLLARAKATNAALITTAKDLARLAHHQRGARAELAQQTSALHHQTQFDDPTACDRLLTELLPCAR